jgi:hypothetical protein
MKPKKLLSYLIIAAFTGLMACEEKEVFVPLKIFSIEPFEALIGDTLIINGEGFSPGEEYNDIVFTGLETKVDPIPLAGSASNPKGLANTETRLYVIVPEGAQPGPITVNLFNEEVFAGPAVNILLPVVESIDPLSAFPNDTITIRGQHFQPVPARNSVKFSDPAGLRRTTATVVGGSPGVLKVLVPTNNAVSGPIAVAGVAGTQTFTIKGPSITSIAPLQGIVGDTLTIEGFGFADDISQIRAQFKTITGTQETVSILSGNTSRRLQVIVPSTAADGPITVVSGTLALVSESTFQVFPSITGINPANTAIGKKVTVSGFGFSDVVSENDLRLSGQPVALFTDPANPKPTPTEMIFVVPAGSVSGPVTLSVKGRPATGSLLFEVAAVGTPVILDISPASGPVGSLVVLNGDFFSPVAAENTVLFGGNVQGEVTVASVKQLTVKVPVDAVTGPITVTKEGKTGTGPIFTLTERATPVIASISPNMAPHESEITITGANFGEFQQDVRVSYQGCGVGVDLTIASFSPTQIVAKLPPRERPIRGSEATANTPVCEGLIYVTLYGRESERETVTISGTPTLTVLSASSGFAGSQLILTGTDFHNKEKKNTVTFSNGITSDTATVVNEDDNSPNTVTVFVPNLAVGTYTVSLEAFGIVSAATFPYQIKEQPVAVKNVFYAVNNVQVDPDGDGSTVTGIKVEKQTFGSGAVQTVYERVGANSLRCMVVDLVNNKVYYATNTRILGRNNTNNTGDETLYTQSTPTTLINDITLDVTEGKLYWTTGNTVMRINASGGAPDPVVYTAATGVVITAIVYEPTTNKLYLYEKTTSSSPTGDIVSLNTNGTGRTVLVPGATNLFDLKIDVAAGKLFYSSSTSGSLTSQALNIFQGNLDGSGSPTLYLPFGGTTTISSGSGVRIAGISLDLTDKYVYFLANPAGATLGTGVYRMRYDGAIIPATDPPATVERVYQVTGGGNPLGQPPSFAAGLAVENTAGASQRMRMALTMEFMSNGEE